VSEETEIPTGKASVESFMGYERRPSVEPEPEAPKVYEGFGAIEEAANDHTRERESATQPPLVEVKYKEPLSSGKMPSTSAEDAAKALSQFHREQNAAELAPDLINLVHSVDEFRAQVTGQAPPQQAAQPDAQQPSDAPAPQVDGPQPEGEPQQPSGLSPKVQAALSDPELRQVFEEPYRQAAAIQQQYAQATTEMAGAAMASVLAAFPEIQGVPPNQIPAVLNYISQKDPAKGLEIRTHLDRANAILGEAQRAHVQQTQQQQQQHRAQFEAFAKQQDEIYSKATANEPAEVKRAVGEELVKYFGEYGIDQQTLMAMWHSSPLMRSAAAQQALHDAMRYRLAARSATANPVRNIPPVMKPGQPRGRADVDYAAIRGL
jgi:hypothetical protein